MTYLESHPEDFLSSLQSRYTALIPRLCELDIAQGVSLLREIMASFEAATESPATDNQGQDHELYSDAAWLLAERLGFADFDGSEEASGILLTSDEDTRWNEIGAAILSPQANQSQG